MTEKCSGKYTRIVANQKSVIDYVLCNANAIGKLRSMSIDEDRYIVDISDHIPLSVFSTSEKFAKTGEIKLSKLTIKRL